MSDFLNWRTLLIFIVAFIIGMALRYFVTKKSKRNSMDRVKRKKAAQKKNAPKKVNYGAVQGAQPKKKKKK